MDADLKEEHSQRSPGGVMGWNGYLIRGPAKGALATWRNRLALMAMNVLARHAIPQGCVRCFSGVDLPGCAAAVASADRPSGHATLAWLRHMRMLEGSRADSAVLDSRLELWATSTGNDAREWRRMLASGSSVHIVSEDGRFVLHTIRPEEVLA